MRLQFANGSLWKVIGRGLDAQALTLEIDRLPAGTRIMIESHGDWAIYDIQENRSLKKINGGGRTLTQQTADESLRTARKLARDFQEGKS